MTAIWALISTYGARTRIQVLSSRGTDRVALAVGDHATRDEPISSFPIRMHFAQNRMDSATDQSAKGAQPMRKLLFVVAAGVVLASCATAPPLPPEKPIADVKSLAGKWTGTVTVELSTTTATGSASGRHYAQLTINEDGTWENLVPTLGPGRFVGTVAVSGGVARWQSVTSSQTGTYRLYEGDGQRVLVVSTNSGIAAGMFTASAGVQKTSP